MLVYLGTAEERLLPPFRPSGAVRSWRADDVGHERIDVALDDLNIIVSILKGQTGASHRSGGIVNYAASLADNTETIYMHIGGGQWTQWLQRLSESRGSGQDLPPGDFPRDPVIERLHRALDAAQNSDGSFRSVYADAVRLAIVARLLGLQSANAPAAQTGRNKSGLPKWRLKQVIDYVDTNFAETISLADLAAAAGLSPMHFAAQVRLATGIRPHEFVLRRRVARAEQLLAETHATLVEIALSVGFQPQAHFTTVFKRFLGNTPRQWRCAKYGSSLPAACREVT